MPSGAEKQLASVSVPAGTWIVKGSVNFQSESSAGSRVAQLRQGGNNIAVQEVQGNANGWTKLTVNDILVLTATTTIAIIAKQTSGGAIICDGYLGLVRINTSMEAPAFPQTEEMLMIFPAWCFNIRGTARRQV